jgi:hypothetical protein
MAIFDAVSLCLPACLSFFHPEIPLGPPANCRALQRQKQSSIRPQTETAHKGPTIKPSNQSADESSADLPWHIAANLCKSRSVFSQPPSPSHPHDSLIQVRSPLFLPALHVFFSFFLLALRPGVCPSSQPSRLTALPPSMMERGPSIKLGPSQRGLPRRSAPSLRIPCPGVANTDWRADGRQASASSLRFADSKSSPCLSTIPNPPRRATPSKTHGLAPPSKLPGFDAWKPPRFHCAFCGSRRVAVRRAGRPQPTRALARVLAGPSHAFAPHLTHAAVSASAARPQSRCSLSSAA